MTNKFVYEDLSGAAHAKIADPKLCEISISLPSQLPSNEGTAAVLAEVWFKLRREPVSTNNGEVYLQYAFKAATLIVECKDCRIDPMTRFEDVLYTLKEVRQEDGSTTFKMGAEGEIGLNFEKLLSMITSKFGARAELRSDLKRTRQVEGELRQEFRSVWSSGAESWTMVGLKNEDGIITDQIIGKEPICHVQDQGAKARIRARVVVDLRDLWVDFDQSIEEGRTPKDRLEANDNKKAVCNALIARGMRVDHSADPLRCAGELEIARATVQRMKPEASDD